MTPAGRIGALIVGLAGLVLAAAAMVREVVLATHGSTDWPLPAWWTRLTEQPSTAATLAAAAGLVTMAFLLLAVWQLGRRRRGPALVEFAGERGWARLDVCAFESALCRRLETEMPGLKARRLELTRPAGVWCARLEADVPARDLDGLQARAFELLAIGLASTVGVRLEALDIVAPRLTAPPAKSA